MKSTERITDIVLPIAKQYGVEKVFLFGSYGRGTEDQNSDYDFLISKGKISSLLEYLSFVHALEDAFNSHVDVVLDTSDDTDFIEQIKKEAILLYEQ